MTLKSILLFVISFFLWGEPLVADGKLVIHSNVPGASVYLDGNDLAKTDDLGNLTIDRLPDGSFSILLKKSGFHPIQSQVEISADKTSELRLNLVAKHPSAATTGTITDPSESGASEETLLPLPPKVEIGTPDNHGQNPRESGGFPGTEQSRILTFGLILFCILGSTFVILLFYKRRKIFVSPVTESDPRTEVPTAPAPPVQSNIPGSAPSKESVERDASFLAELEHREELLRAGFVSEDQRKTRSRQPSDQSIITLHENEYEVKN